MTASLYVHVPFCSCRCGYCDFYSVPVKNDDPRLGKYTERLLLDGEMLFSKYALDSIPSLYIGGGTPSALGARRIKRLMEGLLSLIGKKPAEITIEANPESADETFLEAAKEAGINRISLGVQTFNKDSRLAIGRKGEAALLKKRLSLAADIFQGDFSVDLMSGLPFQDEKILLCDIDKVLEYEPAHISLYSLITAEGTPFFDAVKNGKVKTPDTEETGRLWICGRDYLDKKSFRQYEVSNFCKQGKESIHNMRYWRMENWFALGPAASATIIYDEETCGHDIKGFRYTVMPDVDLWLERKENNAPPSAEERLDRQTLIKETMLMGFRLLEGPDTERFMRRFGKSITSLIPQTIFRWEKKGCLKNGILPDGKERTALTKNGLLFLNRFLVEAFGELPNS